jgi:hypothetical protein
MHNLLFLSESNYGGMVDLLPGIHHALYNAAESQPQVRVL